MSKVAIVGVVGRTNAGKSTLVNGLVGEKVSIVSPVEQTTRNTIRGIVADPLGQLVLLDTPGLHKAEGRLGTLLNKMARQSAAGTDITCLVVDASQKPHVEDLGWIERLKKEQHEKVVVVLNKVDKGLGEGWDDVLAELTHAARAEAHPCQIIKCIATDSSSVVKVKELLFSLAEEGEPLFDEDIVTDYPRKMAIADVIREQFIKKLFQELPHELGVIVKSIDGEDEWFVKADVVVNRESQRPMVLGKNAGLIKWVRKNAEKELKAMFGLKVKLELWVRVEHNWMTNEKLLIEMGYLGAEI